MGYEKSRSVVLLMTPRPPYLIHFDFIIHTQAGGFFDAISSSLFYDIHGLCGRSGEETFHEIFVVGRGTLLEHDETKSTKGDWDQVSSAHCRLKKERTQDNN